MFYINVAFPVSFNTALGRCRLIIFDDSTHDIKILEETIISYSQLVNKKYGDITPTPYTIHITKDIQAFYKQANGPVPEWGIAITKKNPNRIIMQSPSVARISFNRLIQVLIHELNHVYLNNVLNSRSFPSWFKEGMAMHESKEFSINHSVLISLARWNKTLFSIDELKNFNQINKNTSRLAYAESFAMFSSLNYYYGDNIYKNIITAMNQGDIFWEALTHVTADSKDDIKNNINSFLNKKYNWMFLLNSYNLIFLLLPLILIVGYLYKMYKNKKLLRKWEIEELLEDLHNNEAN